MPSRFSISAITSPPFTLGVLHQTGGRRRYGPRGRREDTTRSKFSPQRAQETTTMLAALRYGKARAGLKPAPTAGHGGVTLTPALSRQGRGGKRPARPGRTRGSHPHPSPLPSRERGQEAGPGGESPSPQPSPGKGEGARGRPGPVGRGGVTLTPALSRQGRGGMRPARRLRIHDGNHPHPSPLPSKRPALARGSHPHPSPLPARERGLGRPARRPGVGHGGVTLTPALSRQGRGGKRPPGYVLAPLAARLGGGAGSDPHQGAFGWLDAFFAHLVGGPLHPDALGLGRGAGFAGSAAALGAEFSPDRPGVCRGVLPYVLAVCVDDLSGDPVADFLVVVVLLVFGVEDGGDLVVCLDELVDWVGWVPLGFGYPAVYVVDASLVWSWSSAGYRLPPV